MNSVAAGYREFFDLDEILKIIKEYLPSLNEKRFLEAFEFAETAHHGQMRKDNKTPYISHPVETVEILTTLHADEDTLITALLHDVPEDTSHDIHEIREKFGETVGFLVDGTTKLSKVHYKQNMPERQVESLKKLLLHSAEDLRVIFIKLADRLHNMRTLQNIEKPEKRLRIATETLEIYVPIANLLGVREIKSQLEDLCLMYIHPEEYKELKEKIKSYCKRQEENREKFVTIIKEELKKFAIEAKVVGRKKHFYGIYKKISADGRSLDEIDDRIGVKIVVGDVPVCYQALGLVHGRFVPNTERFKDYIANPKINGYQSLHTTVFGVDGVLTEVQIRTRKMDTEAEYGLAASFFENEKPRDAFSAYLKRSSWVKKILEMEKEDSNSGSFMENLKHDVLQDRIFVFTPKGEPVDLPKGAMVLDFAYAVNADIGHHVLKANVNGKMRPISTVLHNSDVVDLITARRTWPELAWLSFTKTNLAKNKILAYLKKVDINKKIAEGHRILQKELDISGLGLCEDINFKKLNSRLNKEYNKDFENLPVLFEAIGEGEIRAIDVVKAVESGSRRWGKGSKGIKVGIKIVAKNRFRLTRDIIDVLYKYVLDMYTLKGWAANHEEYAYFTATILVDDVATISHIFDELEQIEEVSYVYRISPGRMFLLWLVTVAGGLVWVFHPFILRLLSHDVVRRKYHVPPDLTVYLLLLFIFIIFFYLISVVKKYFPTVRNKKVLWVGIFSVPIATIFVLGMEMFYFNLKLNWLTLLIEILLVYAYVGFNYMNFRRSIR